MADFVKVADLADVPQGEVTLVDFQGGEVALANMNGTIYAFSDSCTHMAGRLSQGLLEEQIVTCPSHGGQFDITSGEAVTEPPTEKLTTYRVQVNDGGEIQLAAP
ncbi:MAG: non-heme iron oxygenase ferredoxin subunit [Chloroflexi bacterium]|nr:non-heme iron oxygenase ferredoxin subunit [Chloroflexota bacterium]